MSIRLAVFPGLAGLLASGAALAEVPRVAADIAPVHSLVGRVMDGIGEPFLIVQPGTSPHAYALRPSQAGLVQEADAIFWIGPELEPWLEDALANLAPEAETVELLDAPGTTTLGFRTGATFAPVEHGHEGHEHEEASRDPAEHGSSHQGIDSHAWLDPENGKVWLDVIAATLGELDPENADAYAANAAAGQAEIDAASDEARDILEPVSDLRFVVFHDAYQYFESRFALYAAGAIALSDASDPSPARIEEIRNAVRDLEVTCILAEPQFNQGLVRTVAEGNDLKSGVIDPMGSKIAAGPDFYPQLIRSVAKKLAGCRE